MKSAFDDFETNKSSVSQVTKKYQVALKSAITSQEGYSEAQSIVIKKESKDPLRY